ncbi:MAG TPA: hypothetical protein VFN21_04110, partial [Acidimicrobiales bacterium]|nr:hypothetical protein [Acidimicrobiales bacterium]
MATSNGKATSRFHRWKGLVKKYLGWSVDDRRTEAEGVAEVREAAPPSEESFAQAHHDVKRSYDEAGLIDRAGR